MDLKVINDMHHCHMKRGQYDGNSLPPFCELYILQLFNLGIPCKIHAFLVKTHLIHIVKDMIISQSAGMCVYL